MTQEELLVAARELVERTCAEQGLPIVATDESTLRRIAAIAGASAAPGAQLVQRREPTPLAVTG